MTKLQDTIDLTNDSGSEDDVQVLDMPQLVRSSASNPAPPSIAALPPAAGDDSVFGAAGAQRYRNWVFTLNNWRQADIDFLNAHTNDRGPVFRYCVFGKEIGPENGTPHLQGFLSLVNPRSFSQIKKMLGNAYHINVSVDPEAAITYCKKDGDVTEWGAKPLFQAKARGARGGPSGHLGGQSGGDIERDRWDRTLDLAKRGRFEECDSQIQVMYLHKLKNVFNHYKLIESGEDTQHAMEWHWGPTGTGKSLNARRNSKLFGDGLFFMKGMNKWWDGYTNQSTVILEDVDPDSCKIMGRYFKIWLDRYSFAAETKGDSTVIRPLKIVITSNYPLEHCFPAPQDYLPLKRRLEIHTYNAFGIAPVVTPRDTLFQMPENMFFNTPAPRQAEQVITTAQVGRDLSLDLLAEQAAMEADLLGTGTQPLDD